jgi:hypothetical protein
MYTEGGKALTGYVALATLYPGLPVPVPYVGGIQSVARRGCAMDRQTPRPEDYQAQQDKLKAEYNQLVGWYTQSWYIVTEIGWDVSQFEPPDGIPTEFNIAKAVYCRQ